MIKSTYHISKMDCPSEENLIRMKLQNIAVIEKLEFDISNRKLYVLHSAYDDEISNQIMSLQLGSKLIDSADIGEIEIKKEEGNQRRMLIYVLLINLSFFFIEMVYGYLSKSMGLVADSLDMLADAIVYSLSLWAIGGTILLKKKVAKTAGYFQIFLATLGFVEILRRVLLGSETPDHISMIKISFFALLANAICLYILQKSKSKEEAHMKASMIFTSNDIIINIGVITAGVLVLWLDSSFPDLLIGSFVFAIVIRGATRILKLG